MTSNNVSKRRWPIRQTGMRARVLLLCAWGIAPLTAHGAEATVAVVDFDLIDTSLQGEMQGPLKADVARLNKTVEQIRQQLDDSRLFKVVDNKATRRANKRLQEEHVYLHDCNSCEMKVGQVAQSNYVLVGWVQKVSNLILNLNIVLRKVPGGEDIVGSSVDMRGNTDEAWSRAATWLLEREVFPEYRETQVSASAQ